MSAPPRGSQVSSPSKNASALRSKAEVGGYTQEQLKHDLEIDLQSAKRCGFDNLLKHFFYLVLKKNCKQKKELDELQAKIEKIQSDRYYPNADAEQQRTDVQPSSSGQANESEGAGDGLADSDIQLGEVRRDANVGERSSNSLASGSEQTPAATQVNETERFGEGPEDPKERTPTEAKLIQERDEILDNLLNDAIEEILPVANSSEMRQFLINFEAEFKNAERKRYAPYVELCNGALHHLLNAGQKLPIRPADRLDIRFQVNDPNPIPSQSGDAEVIERKPDVIISSSAVLGQKNYHEAYSSVRWCSVLSCHEFKISGSKKPEGMVPDLKNHKYTGDDIPEETSHDKLKQLDIAIEQEGNTEPGSQVSTGAKRSQDVASLGVPEGQPPAKKRTSAGSRANSNAEPGAQQKTNKKTDTKKQIESRVQCASYALEMLSYCAGVHHAINILFTDGIFWVWYYDRQGILQSSGVSIFHDFPRFLVLLLIFQRFSLEDWGIIPDFNPDAISEHSKPPPVQKPEPAKSNAKKDTHPDRKPNTSLPVVVDLPGKLENLQDYPDFRVKDSPKVELSRVELDMNEYLSYRPHCLAGRATAVVAAKGFVKDTNQQRKMVCKVYHPEVQRRNEGLTMKVVYEIVKDDMVLAKQNEERAKLGIPSMANYLPQFYFCADVKGTTTHRIRSMVNCRWKGHRIMRIIGMKELKKITTVKGWPFVKAWLEGMICHAFLWKNFIEHGDPSLGNLMYDETTGCGVLTDFDLSLLQWEPRIFGTDRTGTIPFMAIGILSKNYWEGKIKRYYHHELESFIWILLYVFLLYQAAKRQSHPKVDLWRTSSYDICREKKNDFLKSHLLDLTEDDAQIDFKECWTVASRLGAELLTFHVVDISLRDFHAKIRAKSQNKPVNLSDTSVTDSGILWDKVLKTLEETLLEGANSPIFKPLLGCMKFFQPGFALDTEKAGELHKKFKTILGAAAPPDTTLVP